MALFNKGSKGNNGKDSRGGSREDSGGGSSKKGKSRKLLVEKLAIGVLLKVSGQPSGQSSQTETLKKWPICKMLGLSDPSTRNLTLNFS